MTQEKSTPPFLNIMEPLEMEDLPLQVSLLTLEVAALRQRLWTLSDLLETAAKAIEPAQATMGLDQGASSPDRDV